MQKSSAGKDSYMFNTNGEKINFADKDITMHYYREKQLLVVQPQLQVKEYDVYKYNNNDITRMLKNIPGKCSMWEKCPDKFELYGFVLASLDLPSDILFYKNILAGAWSGMKASIISNRIAKKIDMNGVSEIISKYQPIAEEKLASDVSEGYDAIRVRNNTILVDTPGGSCTGFFAGKNKVITVAHLPEVRNDRQGRQNTNIKIIIPTPGKELPDGKTCGVKRWVANALMDTAILYVDDSCNHTDSLVIENTPGSISRFTYLYAFSPIKK